MKYISRKQFLFLGIFTLLSVLADNVNIAKIIGAEQSFTLFQFLGPIAGGFLGSVLGPLAVLLAESINFIAYGKAFTAINLLRLLPMVVAAFYFGTLKEGKQYNKIKIAIPAACMALFIAHPIGRTAWPYALFWLIPVTIRLGKLSNSAFLRSLGATFTAHAVGSTAFLYSIGLSKEVWLGLIPVVAVERLLFASGIFASYVAMTTVLDKLSRNTAVKEAVEINKKNSLLSYLPFS